MKQLLCFRTAALGHVTWPLFGVVDLKCGGGGVMKMMMKMMKMTLVSWRLTLVLGCESYLRLTAAAERLRASSEFNLR